jgi:hypothetical protein
MADSNDEFDDVPEGEEASEAGQAAALERLVAQLPPELFETLQPLLLVGGLANHMLLGYDNDPVPAALQELLGYDLTVVKAVGQVHDTPSLGRLLATQTLQLFDFLLVAHLVFESELDEPLRAFLGRRRPASSAGVDTSESLRDYMLNMSETMLENIGQYLAAGNDELREALRMRRLQTESIFARLGETLRPYYPPGHSPVDDETAALDQFDEDEDQDEVAVSVVFNAVQRVTLGTALLLPGLLLAMGETPFALALGGVARFRAKAMQRLADRLKNSPADEPFDLAWSELLRLYQAAQVCALSTVADVAGSGSLEDVMLGESFAADQPDGPADPAARAEYARHTREMITLMMAGFIQVVEDNYPDDVEVIEAKAEISKLAELLVE